MHAGPGGLLGAAVELAAPGQRLEEQQPQRVDVDRRAERRAEDLLGGEVGDGADRVAGAAVRVGLPVAQGHPQVAQAGVPAAVEQHVGRLHVAVDQTLGVQVGQGGGDVAADDGDLAPAQRPAGQRRVEVGAVDELQGEVRRAGTLPRGVQDADQAGVRQVREQPALVEEPQPVLGLATLGAGALEGHVTAQAQVVRAVDGGGATEGDELLDPVAAHGLGACGRLGGVGLGHGEGSSRVRSLQGFPRVGRV